MQSDITPIEAEKTVTFDFQDAFALAREIAK